MKNNRAKLISKLVAVAMIVVLGIFALVACDLFGGNNSSSSDDSTNSGNNSNSNETVQISVYRDGIPTNYTATYGQRLDLGVLVKSGSMIKNVTDANGNVYFDYTGKSLTSWEKSYPTEFYANFIPVGNLSYTYDTEWTEAMSISSARGWRGLSFGFQSDLRKQFQSALRGNPDRKVKISVTYRERGEKYSDDLGFRVIVNSDEVVYTSWKRHISDIYDTTKHEIELDASFWVNGFSILWKGENLYNHYVKNVEVTIQFV